MSTCRIPAVSAFAGRDVMPRARRAHSRSGADAGLSFTQRVVAELAPYTPLLPVLPAFAGRGSGAGDHDSGRDRDHASGRGARGHAGAACRTGSRRTSPGSPPRGARSTCSSVSTPPILRAAVGTHRAAGRSRLRGAFLGAGRLVRPDGEPYLEIGCAERGAAPSSSSTISTSLGVRRASRRRRGRWVVTVRSGAGVGAALSSIGAQAGRLALRVRAGDPRGAQRREPPPQRRDRQPAPDGGRRGSSARVRSRRSRPTRRAGRRCRPRSARPPSSGPSTPTTTLRSWRSWPAAAGRRWPGGCTAWSPRRARAVIGWKSR